MYNLFLLLISQLSTSNQAQLLFQDQEIVIVKGPKRWKLSTKIFTLDEEGSKSAKESLNSFRAFKWQDQGACLKVEGSSVFLVQEIAPLVHYLYFRELITDFADSANEWKEILEERLFAKGLN